ncbi:hypothetical protein Tco_0089581 [Tanacetum coccineum]
MANSHNQSITDGGLKNRPSILEKGSYMKTITDQGNPTSNPRVPPFERDQVEADLTGDDKKRFKADIDAMNAILLGIPNDIYNSIDAFSQLTSTIMEQICHNVHQFRNPHEVDYDQLYDYLKQNENNVNASRAKRDVRTHDPLALITNHYVVPSSSHTSLAYYVTHPLSVNDFDVETQSYEFQGDASNDDPIDNLTTAMMLLEKAMTKNVGNAGRNTGRIAGNSGNATLVNKLMETIRLCKEIQG